MFEIKLELLRGEYLVDSISLSGLKARVVKGKDGRFNFSDLTEAQAKTPSEPKKGPQGSTPLVFDISSVSIENAAIQYIDQQAGQEYAIEDFRLKTGRIAQDAQGKLELGMVAKRKAPALTVKLSAEGSYQLKGGVLSGDVTDKAEAIANDLALLLDDWRQKTNDVIPSDFAGTRVAERYTETYLRNHGPQVTSRSAIASERGIDDHHRLGQ